MTGRPLRPPRWETALDRAWRRRQWRLERAHDDWGLHATSGDPRAPIHRASGLVRLCRQSVRDKIRAHRKTVAGTKKGTEATIFASSSIADAVRNYRLAVTELARAVAAFDERNKGVGAAAQITRQSKTRISAGELTC